MVFSLPRGSVVKVEAGLMFSAMSNTDLGLPPPPCEKIISRNSNMFISSSTYRRGSSIPKKADPIVQAKRSRTPRCQQVKADTGCQRLSVTSGTKPTFASDTTLAGHETKARPLAGLQPGTVFVQEDQDSPNSTSTYQTPSWKTLPWNRRPCRLAAVAGTT